MPQDSCAAWIDGAISCIGAAILCVGGVAETPKPGELNARCFKLADSDDLAEAARRHAERLGFHAVIDNACDDWSYDAAANYLLKRLRELRRQHSRVCLISAGEVTVRVTRRTRARVEGVINTSRYTWPLSFALRMGRLPCYRRGRTASTATATRRRDCDEQTLDGDSLRESAMRALVVFDSSTWLSAAEPR